MPDTHKSTVASRRVGARRLAAVTPEVREALERGELSTATHIEHMALDQASLWRHIFPDLKDPTREFAGLGFIGRLRAGGRRLLEEIGPDAYLLNVSEPDTVLAWRAFAIAAAGGNLHQQFRDIRPFAEHPHFGVREWAWLAVRPRVAAAPSDALAVLSRDVTGAGINWRRFASEVTRPRSVWGAHIPELKGNPSKAEPLLAALLLDESPYVTISVTNWLNDVSRDHRAWVEYMCKVHGGTHYERLLRRAIRSSLR